MDEQNLNSIPITTESLCHELNGPLNSVRCMGMVSEEMITEIRREVEIIQESPMNAASHLRKVCEILDDLAESVRRIQGQAGHAKRLVESSMERTLGD